MQVSASHVRGFDVDVESRRTDEKTARAARLERRGRGDFLRRPRYRIHGGDDHWLIVTGDEESSVARLRQGDDLRRGGVSREDDARAREHRRRAFVSREKRRRLRIAPRQHERRRAIFVRRLFVVKQQPIDLGTDISRVRSRDAVDVALVPRRRDEREVSPQRRVRRLTRVALLRQSRVRPEKPKLRVAIVHRRPVPSHDVQHVIRASRVRRRRLLPSPARLIPRPLILREHAIEYAKALPAPPSTRPRAPSRQSRLKRPQRRPVPRAPRRRSSPRRHHHAPRPARSRARVPPLAKIIRRVVPHPLRLRDDVRVVSRVVSRVFVVSRVSRVVVARRVRRAAAIARVVVVVVVVVVARTARVARRAVASSRAARDGARDGERVALRRALSLERRRAPARGVRAARSREFPVARRRARGHRARRAVASARLPTRAP